VSREPALVTGMGAVSGYGSGVETLRAGLLSGRTAIGPFDQGEGSLLRHPGDGPVSALAWDKAGVRLAFGTEAGAAGIFDLSA